ncbi:glycoside hydrolase family 32 protein [Martelella mediterranea]|nr:glycoside hydrolase family 32 protein [Martelella mediterranea]
MQTETLSLENGELLEFWARGRNLTPHPFRITIDGQTVYSIASLARWFDHFSYRHREAATVTVAWDPEEIEISFAYSYRRETVLRDGITLWQFHADRIERHAGAEIDALLRSDPTRPQCHFSPVVNWMNDPNGLCRIGDDWHLFYQLHPTNTEWGPMHWGHAVSKDLFSWTHLPVFLHPGQNLERLEATGGAFSGTAFRDRDGKLRFYYTERLPAYDLFRHYREIQKIAEPSDDMVVVEGTRVVIEERPAGVEHDFRDPKVWWDAEKNAYRMVLGASIDADPAVLLYGSPCGKVWEYIGPLYRAPDRYKAEGARAVECPDFFRIGDKWVLIMGFVGHNDPATGRHNLLYALTGDFADDRFVPDDDAFQLLDFGTDFYALQSFSAGDRQVAFAWLFNWEYRKPAGSPYSGELSLPRELTLDNRNRLCMNPVTEYGQVWPPVRLSGNDGDYAIANAPFEIALEGLIEGTRIVATQDGDISFEISVAQNMLSITLPQDDGSIRYVALVREDADLRVVHDAGIIEVFAEGGAICGTRRNYRNITPDRLRIDTPATALVCERRRT